MVSILSLLIPLGVCVVLPVMIVWLVTRENKHETDKRAEIVLAAIEKNPDVDIQEFLKKLNPPKKSLKQKLMDKFQTACVLTALGIGIFGVALAVDYKGGMPSQFLVLLYISGMVTAAVGIAYFIAYSVGKRMWREELKSEGYGTVDHEA